MYGNIPPLFKDEYEITCRQYVSARVTYEKRCGSLSNMYLWCALGLIIAALPFIFLRSMMSISYGWIATAALSLFGITLAVVYAFVKPNIVSAQAENEYRESPIYSGKHCISLYRDTFIYENQCETVSEYYSQTTGVIETKESIIIAVDTLGRLIVIPKGQNSNTLSNIFREKYNRKYL